MIKYNIEYSLKGLAFPEQILPILYPETLRCGAGGA
jgi:hypothetical protein